MLPQLLLLGTALASWQDVVQSSRLPRAYDGSIGVVPRNYQVELSFGDLNSENFEYSGVVEIDFEWNLGDFGYIALNVDTFTYGAVTLDGQPVEYFQEGGFLFIVLPDEWQKGEIENNIRIEFTGIIDYVEAGSFNEGFFIDYYIGPNGEFNNILVTQFESCGGRKAFPMFDEPEYKATFNLEVTLNGNEGYYALWNTDANEVIERSNSSVTYVFDRSPKMSSYLFSLSLVNYVYIEGIAPETGTRMRVYSPKWVENIEFSYYALEAGISILDGLSDFFGYNYSDSFEKSPKLDQIGFPNSGLGAMENWGLVTYDYAWLFTNQDKMTEFWTSDVAATVAHELVHQWTGNLITAEWWDELWINEGFAEWGGAFGLQYVDSSVAWENYLFQYDSDWAYWVDQTRNSRPVVNKQNNDGFVVDTCEAIDAQFDGIAYSKGSMLIRMIIDVIGLDAFQAKFEL